MEEREEEEKLAFTQESIPAHRLCDLGSDLLVQDNDGNNALHFLLSKTPYKNSHFDEAIALIVEKAPSLIHQKNKTGFKPLHIAIQKTRMWPIKTLLAAGGDILEPDLGSNTILHFLAEKLSSLNSNEDQISHIKHFLSLGLLINSPNRLGETPIFWYLRMQATTNLDDKTTHDTGISADDNAKLERDMAFFIELGGDLFHRNHEGETLLHIVAKRPCDVPVETLWSINDFNKAKALQERKIKHMMDSFKWLLKEGFDPMIEDNRHRTTLDVAAACGNKSILELFRGDRVPSREAGDSDTKE